MTSSWLVLRRYTKMSNAITTYHVTNKPFINDKFLLSPIKIHNATTPLERYHNQ